MERKKPNKDRAEKYEDKLYIKGTLDEVLKVSVTSQKDNKGKEQDK